MQIQLHTTIKNPQNNNGISMFLKTINKLTFHTENKSFVCRCQASHPIPGSKGCKFQSHIVQISYWHHNFAPFFNVE